MSETKHPDIPHIWRTSYPEDHFDGYVAKVIRKTGRLQRRFHIDDFGGSEEKCAEAAAKAVAEFVKAHPRLSRRQVSEIKRKKKDEDLPTGVRRRPNVIKGKEYMFIQAYWSPVPNKQIKRVFSVDKYGEEDAIVLAIEARADGLDEIERNENGE